MIGISMRKSKKTRIKCSETHFGSAALPSCQLEISPFQAKKIVFGTVHKVWGHIFNVPKCTLRDDLIPSAAAFFNSIQCVSSETICTQWKCFKNCDLHYRRRSQCCQEGANTAAPRGPLLWEAEADLDFSGCETHRRRSRFLSLHWENRIFRGPDLVSLWWVTRFYYLHFFKSVMSKRCIFEMWTTENFML